MIPITSICLNITENCNFNCRYCFVHQSDHNMPFEIADDTVKWLNKNKEEYKNINGYYPKDSSVFFFGGEPTLRWYDLIVPLVEKYPNEKYSITTNGYLLDKDKIDFMKEHNFSVMLSMDGNEATQNYNRKEGSFQKLDEMIPYLLQQVENTNFRGTIIPHTCDGTFDNICYAQEKGFKSCYFAINIFEKWSPEAKEKLELEIKKYVIAYISSFINEKYLINFTPFTNMIALIIKNQLGLLDNNINIYKCGLGNGYAAINYKGDIYSCQEIITSYKVNKDFCLGNIYNGLDQEARNNLAKLIVNDLPIVNNENNECEKCPLLFCCKKNSCQVNNYLCNQHCLIQSYNQCWWNLLLYKYASFTISTLQDLPNFQKYMEEIILKEA